MKKLFWFRKNGVKIDTVSLKPATIRVRTDVKAVTNNLDVVVEKWYQDKLVGTGLGSDITIEVPEAKLWNAENPNLYCCKVLQWYFGSLQLSQIRGKKNSDIERKRIQCGAYLA